ncbi:FAD-binding oxidoreductase [Acetonema longum]|uniref:Glycolate oxidase subunit n=1 Tax=Acetonema longum DSM 6540 TaxID=1009370 RepID=F7NMX3_9FIRM|nr:FAD-linked oxidase C-terminal domain-containing protein [Acetonema longum]EGO62617.1 glycolate oxidase subunit [Acetonema longum DSM 6540]
MKSKDVTGERLSHELSGIMARERVLYRNRDLKAYEYDSTHFRNLPLVIVLPETTEEVREIVKLARRFNIPVTPRGAGTSLSGGAVPTPGGIMMPLTRMNKILEIDIANGIAVVQPGITNKELQDALKPFRYWFPPDPASLSVATIGGNVAENAGGPHCLKYGVTSNHVMGLEVVLPNGDAVNLGGAVEDIPGYDVSGLLTGSEGTMGIITSVAVKISRQPEATSTILAIFNSCWDAAVTVFEVIKNGFNPAVLEMLEERMLHEVNEVFNLGYPDSAKALLIIEVDGRPEGLPFELDGILKICRQNKVQVLEVAKNEQERETLWRARRGGTSALGRLKPDSAEIDIVVPRSQLPHVVEKFQEISARNGVILGALIHAGDGNCHPQVPFDGRIHEEREAAERALGEIMQAAVDLGGTISGEHGIGLEKISGMPLVFSPDEIMLMHRLKRLFDPANMLNPDKIFLAGTPQGKEGSHE